LKGGININGISYNLKDKVVLVTGGSRGIGLELLKTLMGEKAKVAFCARKQEGLEAALSELQQLGAPENILAVQAHIAREEEVENLFQKVMEKYGRLDILVNNVGTNLPTPSLAETDYALWQKIIDTNLNGTFLCSRTAARIMRSQQKGKIINISSIASRRASPGMGIYGIAKAGIEMLTRVLAAELAPYNVQVNAVAPAMVKTSFSKPFWSDAETYDSIIKRIPLGRIASPMDIVHPVLFLASEASGFITGETIIVDGGATIV